MKGNREFVLSRELEGQTIALMLTIKEFDRHDEILSVLKLFRANHHITKETVNEELLFMPAESPYGQNVLRAIEEYGLIREMRDGMFELTLLGEDSIGKEKIPTPKRGVYLMFLSKDPLLQYKILSIEPYDTPEKERRSVNKEVDVPEWIGAIIDESLGKTIDLAMSDLRPVVVEEYGSKGYVFTTSHDLRLSLILSTDGETSLKFIGKKEVSLRPPEDINPFDALKQILSDFGTLTTVNEVATLLVSAENLTDNEIKSFFKSFKLGKPTLNGYGDFDPVDLQAMNIMPSNERQAILWASRLLVTKIDNYVGEPEYNVLIHETARKFHPLYSETVVLNSLASYFDALQAARNGEENYRGAYWYLMAPNDLSIGGK